MRTYIECFPCFLQQTVIAINQQQVRDKDTLYKDILKDVLPIIEGSDMNVPPALTSTYIHKAVRKRLGHDPFEKVKREYNSIALGLYEGLKEKIANSQDPLLTAARLAIAGNIIDFGIFASVNIEDSIERALEPDIAVDDYQSFIKRLSNAREILYLLDNAGEIVFDRLLIEELVAAGKKVKAVVKGSPVLNDATIEDAVQTGITDICEVIDNGSDAIGTILHWTSPAFQDEFSKAGLIISKGQANFETVTDAGERTYFLFQAKCEVIARELGMPVGSMLFRKG